MLESLRLYETTFCTVSSSPATWAWRRSSRVSAKRQSVITASGRHIAAATRVRACITRETYRLNDITRSESRFFRSQAFPASITSCSFPWSPNIAATYDQLRARPQLTVAEGPPRSSKIMKSPVGRRLTQTHSQSMFFVSCLERRSHHIPKEEEGILVDHNTPLLYDD